MDLIKSIENTIRFSKKEINNLEITGSEFVLFERDHGDVCLAIHNISR